MANSVFHIKEKINEVVAASGNTTGILQPQWQCWRYIVVLFTAFSLSLSVSVSLSLYLSLSLSLSLFLSHSYTFNPVSLLLPFALFARAVCNVRYAMTVKVYSLSLISWNHLEFTPNCSYIRIASLNPYTK